MDTLGSIYLQSAIARVKYYKQLADDTFSQLEEKDFYFQPGTSANSIAIIIQHVSGNMLSRWTDFLTGDGEKDWRNRDTEFNDQQHTATELIAIWESGWKCFIDALTALTPGDLLTTIYIRREPLSAIDAINRQLAHYPYHAGQIVYIGKMIKGDRWKSLSIEKGKSDDFNAMMAAKA